VNPSFLTIPPIDTSSTTTTSTTTTTTTTAGPGPTSGAGQLGGTVRTAGSTDADVATDGGGGMSWVVYVALGGAVVLVAAGGIIVGRARASGD